MCNLPELPRYRSHKNVSAVKILEIRSTATLEQASDGSAYLVPTEEGYGRILVTREFMLRHEPEVGGYYVQYEDGYESYSPAKAFEDGYTRI